MEPWTQLIQNLEDRCDFASLQKKKGINNNHDDGGDTLSQIETNSNILKLPKSLASDLVQLCKEYSISLPYILQFAWHQVLHIYGNGTRTVILASGHGSNGYKNDLFPVIVNHIQCTTPLDIAKEIQSQINSSIANKEYNMIDQFDEYNFDSLFVYGKSPTPGHHGKLPFSVYINEYIDTESITITMNFAQGFDPIIMAGILEVMQTVLEQIAPDFEAPISSIDYLPQRQLLQMAEWNNTNGDFPSIKRLNHLFEEAAAKYLDNVAIIYNDLQMTYKELNQKSNQLGHYLNSTTGVKPEQFIVLFLDKTEATLVSILGIWKSGGAWVPIDPTYPDDRVRVILEDTMANVVITNARHSQRLQNLFKNNIEIFEIESIMDEMHGLEKPTENLELNLTSSQLAYLTYTSGTTGVPKGVFKYHQCVVNSITDLGVKYAMVSNPGDEVVVLFSAYVFEPFVRQSMIALLNGHKLVIVNDDEKLDVAKFPNFLKRHGVTYLNGTTSVLQEHNFSTCPELKRLILIGEELTPSRYQKLRETYKARIINEYGFTESALVTALKIFDPEDQRTDRTLGKPLRNVKCYVLDQNLRQVPVGAIGELHIGGLGISKGYLNLEKLTKEKFIPNPFQSEEDKSEDINSRIYKTGDLARWTPSGEVEYIGRNDFQIKLRGIRIEPAEIETILMGFPGIARSIIVAKSSGGEEEKQLVGYFVAEIGISEVSEEKILAYLETKLPRYMIPARMIQISSIPVTINGKLDFRALPDVVPRTPRISAPKTRNELDFKLSQIWSQALGIPADQIGITDDFIRLGGHSITCIQLIARIRQELHLEVSLEEIFKFKTIEKLSNHLKSNGKPTSPVNPELSVVSMENNNSQLLANSLQQGLMYHYLKQGGVDDAYILQSIYKYNVQQKLDINKYELAWKIAQKKFPALRLRFLVEAQFYQLIDEDQKLDWNFIDLTTLGSPENRTSAQEAFIFNLQKSDRTRRYSLESGQLFRIYLIQLSKFQFTLLFSCHHIILDGWSLPVLFSFVHETYLALHRENKNIMDKAFEDVAYAHAQKYIMDHREDHVMYWTDVIQRIGQRVDLSGILKDELKFKVQLNQVDHVRESKSKTLSFDPELCQKLRVVTIETGVTLHSVLQFIWHKVLQTYGAAEHTVVGTTVSGRNLPIVGVETSVGLFINTLPLVVDHSRWPHNGENAARILDAINDIQSKVILMNGRSNVELGHLDQGQGQLKHALFDSLFVLENYPSLDRTKQDDHRSHLGFEWVADFEKLDYPLAVIAREMADGALSFTLAFAGELFEEETIDDLLGLTKKLLSQVVKCPTKQISTLNLLLPHQLELLKTWNSTQMNFSNVKTLHQIFEEQSKEFPDKIAVIYEDIQLTYSELNSKANQLARNLLTLVNLQPNDIVALLLDKSELQIFSILSVWKSGAAYVPIDPSYPDQRIRFILEDTKAQILITNERHISKVKELGMSVHLIQIEPVLKQLQLASTDLHSSVCSTDLAYIIYTSGTTGTPKGVMIEHRGVVNLQESLANIFNLKPSLAMKDEVILSFSNYVFDHFVEQMTDALLNGQTLCVLNDEMRSDKERLRKYMRDNHVTYLSGTPSVLSLYEYSDLPSLRRIDAVGEDFTEPVYNSIRAKFGGLIINGYGPTEVSITSHKRLYYSGERRADKSIGHAVGNMLCYVLDKNLNRVPPGAVGELFLGGVGVGRGYLNRPDLTSKVFLPDPFEEKEGSRMYRTGDLVRFLRNGEVEYLGRNDSQVKVRGLRIELSEIEQVVLSYPAAEITRCVITTQTLEDSNKSSAKFIVGYFVEKSNKYVEESELKKHVQAKLPGYMVPNRLVQLDSIGVTVSGKVDMKQLPNVKFSRQENSLEDLIVGPALEIKLKLRTIWADLLHIPEELIRESDDIFGLGSDSLLVTKLSFLIQKSFGRVVNVAQIFQLKTLGAIAQFIVNGSLEFDQLEIQGQDQSSLDEMTLSLGQESLLFLDEMEGGTDAFNIVFHFKISGEVIRNLDILHNALSSIVKRHPVLRTFMKTSQIVDIDNVDKFFQVRTLFVSDREELDCKMAAESGHIFQLDKEFPFRATFFSIIGFPDIYMTLVFHHIGFDGWSWTIFERELNEFYKFFAKEDTPLYALTLPHLKANCSHYSSWQRKLVASNQRLQTLTKFWLDKLKGHESLNLIPDFSRPSKFDYSGHELRFELDAETTSGLRHLAKALRMSLFSLLAGAYCLCLSHFTNQKDILIGVPVSMRNRPEFEHVIGYFVNLLVLRVSINSDKSLADYLRAVSEEVIQAHVHQDLPFEKLVKELGVAKDLSRHPLVQAVFSLNPFKPIQSRDPAGLQVTSYNPQHCHNSAKYDLTTTMTETDGGLSGNFTFPAKLFHTSSVESVMKTFTQILKVFSNTSDSEVLKVKDVNLIENPTSATRISHANINFQTSPTRLEDNSQSSTSLTKIFEEIAEANSKKAALVSGSSELTFGELNESANRLAHLLHVHHKVGNGNLVALFLDKSDYMIQSILGVWKAGAAYVPIDPKYPDERIRFILDDAQVKVVITNEIHSGRLSNILYPRHSIAHTTATARLLEVDSKIILEELNRQPKSNPNVANSSDDLSYVIYTSGTTGTPKGILVQQRGLVDLRFNLISYHFRDPDQEQAVLLLSNYIFDFSLEQILLGLFSPNSKLILPHVRRIPT